MTVGNPLLTAGIVGPLLFVVVFMVDGATRPGYRPTYHTVSALSLGPRGWIQTTNFVVCGILVAAAAAGIEDATSSTWLSGMLGTFGLGLVASGVFPMDPVRGYPPGIEEKAPEELSLANRLHDAAGFVVFGSLPVAAGIAAFTLDSTPWSVYSGLTASITAAGFLVFGAAWESDHPLAGLAQRVVMVVGWTWLAALCWHLAG